MIDLSVTLLVQSLRFRNNFPFWNYYLFGVLYAIPVGIDRSYTPLTRLLHASYTALVFYTCRHRLLLHASYTPLTRLVHAFTRVVYSIPRCLRACDTMRLGLLDVQREREREEGRERARICMHIYVIHIYI